MPEPHHDENKKRYELVGIVHAFLENRNIKELARVEPNFKWWYLQIAKKFAELQRLEK